MDDTNAYETGYQIGMILDIGIWMLLGFLITKFLIGKLYLKNTGAKIPNNIVVIVTILFGVLRAFMVLM